mgnify:CR=1 FL=1
MNSKVSFNFNLNFEYEVVATISPLIRRVIARNPSAFTYHGTGTYIVGQGEVAVIDPGPRIQSHIAALIRALENEKISHLIVTHTHMDHSPACVDLKKVSQAPTYGYGPHGIGKGLVKAEIEEGADWSFIPDILVADGDVISGRDWTLKALHTPGHTSNHLCYHLQEENALFTGDHVMGWSTTIVAPPDGDMGQYLSSLRLLLQRNDRCYVPTHGPLIENPQVYVKSLLEHRRSRQDQIIKCLGRGESQISQMVNSMYPYLEQEMRPAAALQVLAALIDLTEQRRVLVSGPPTLESSYAISE